MSIKKLTREDRLRLMRFVCAFAWADLDVKGSEKRFVHKLVKQLQLDATEAKQVEQWLEVPPKAEDVDPNQVPRAHRKLFLETARNMIEADGSVSAEERESLTLLAQLLER
jgi:uncharacterized tellurite resistance protein B-like protein